MVNVIESACCDLSSYFVVHAFNSSPGGSRPGLEQRSEDKKKTVPHSMANKICKLQINQNQSLVNRNFSQILYSRFPRGALSVIAG